MLSVSLCGACKKYVKCFLQMRKIHTGFLLTYLFILFILEGYLVYFYFRILN